MAFERLIWKFHDTRLAISPMPRRFEDFSLFAILSAKAFDTDEFRIYKLQLATKRVGGNGGLWRYNGAR